MRRIPKRLSSKHCRDHWVRAVDGLLSLDAGFRLEIPTLAVSPTLARPLKKWDVSIVQNCCEQNFLKLSENVDVKETPAT
jgi:hypothetical protein